MDVTINACEVLNLSGGEKIKTYESNLEIPDKIPDAQGEENEDNIKILSELSTSLDEDAVTDPAKLDPAVLEVRVTTKVRSQQSDDAPSVHELGTSKFDNPQPPALPVCPPDKFVSMVRQQEMALNLLSPDQLALLLQYVATLRQQRNSHQKALECALCKNNGRPISWYSSHALKDWRGRVLCPVLRAFRCPRCGATGDRAHTIKYCPLNNDAVMARRR